MKFTVAFMHSLIINLFQLNVEILSSLTLTLTLTLNPNPHLNSHTYSKLTIHLKSKIFFFCESFWSFIIGSCDGDDSDGVEIFGAHKTALLIKRAGPGLARSYKKSQ